MKVVYQTCCGVDVHKSFLVATIIKTTSCIEPSYQKKRFSTFNNSILQFKDWLIENLVKMLYLAMMDITKKWTGHRQDWGQIHSQLEIYFEERLS
jgi:transposase-like protein